MSYVPSAYMFIPIIDFTCIDYYYYDYYDEKVVDCNHQLIQSLENVDKSFKLWNCPTTLAWKPNNDPKFEDALGF